MITAIRLMIRFLASYGFAVVLLFFLFVLTFLGTVEQVEHGLFLTQKKYFESFYVLHEVAQGINILLPGAYLLMALLFVNLLLGAIVRAPKSWTRPGMLIAHSGILLLLLGGYVTYHYSLRGHMSLFEGERSNRIVSYHDWEIAITDTANEKQFVIPQVEFAGLNPNQSRTFTSGELPFDLMIEGFAPNSTVTTSQIAAQGVDGYALVPLPLEKEAEQNVPGAYAIVVNKKDPGETFQGILHGMSPIVGGTKWVVDVAGGTYAIDLRRVSYEVPFTIVLDKFIHEVHPGTSMASNYESVVTQIDGETSRQIEIKMNEPLRDRGYTFFQASFGPKNARPGERMYSVFEVVSNPADQWPLYSCLIITFGLSLHFVQRLVGYLKRENRRRA